MVCPECKIEKGCGCTFFKVKGRDQKVCPDCKIKIDNLNLNNNNGELNPKPNIQGV